MYKILLAGRDSRLLATRAAVLQKISDHVVSCNASEAPTVIESESPNLVVLCHSLSLEDAEKIADKAHERGDGTRVLMLLSEADPNGLERETKFDAVTLSGPARLIKRTTELLQESPTSRFDGAVNGRQATI
jgi:hypothetical protein